MPDSFDAKSVCKRLPNLPGVYRMLDENGEIVYVGKAKSLKKRVSSYFNSSAKSVKTLSMVEFIHDIEVTVTSTEAEALILEDSLIKNHRPKYNILLRDDKTYPYVRATIHDEFPRLTFYRGRRKKQSGELFGPYPSALAVRETINTLQKVFKIRSCEDSYFKHRTRPCLQYQIKRCSGPCVDYISAEAYQRDIQNAIDYLRGNSQILLNTLVAQMDEAAAALNYEEAAKVRDQITLLRELKEQQMVSGSDRNIDVVSLSRQAEKVCTSFIFIRDGRVLGSKTLFPKGKGDDAEWLGAVLSQYYLENDPPAEIIVPFPVVDQDIFEAAMRERHERSVTVKTSVRGQRLKWLKLATLNAEQALAANMGKAQYYENGFRALRDWLQSPAIHLIECFDISHSQGERAVASCTCFNVYGALKERYRRFNISGITPGDDYAAMRQAVYRHFKRLKCQDALPDILLIDGGPNQVAKAVEALAELELGFSDVTVVGIAKGPTRKLGDEELYINDSRTPIRFEPHDAGLRVLQAVRDEAHRFALTGHRRRREKARVQSSLETIPGLGPKRRQALLKGFGGLQGVARATVTQLASVEGISESLAERIFEHFNGNK